MKKLTSEEKCSLAWKKWNESAEEGSRYSSAGYADDPRALRGFFTAQNSQYYKLSTLWPEAKLSESTIGLHASLADMAEDGFVCGTGRWMSDHFTVHGSGLDPITGQEVLVINLIDGIGKVRQLRLPRGVIVGNDAQFASFCADRGFNISLDRICRASLKAILSGLKGRRITLTDRSGWIDAYTFVLPTGRVLGDPSRRVVFTADKTVAANTVITSGDYDTWKAAISRTVPNNSRLELALCAALYSPLMRFDGGAQCAIFHIYGESSLGKTTSGYVFGSVWGGDPNKPLRYAHSWNRTYHSLNALAGAYSGIGLSLDEIQHCPNPDIAYSFSEGTDKGRLTADAKQKVSRTWQCVAWSTGEKRLDDLVSENYKTKDSGVQSGREARFFDIPVTGTGSIRGVVESLNGFSKPEELIAELSDTTRDNYGHAGPALVSAIIDFVDENGEDALKAKFGEASSVMLAALGLADDANPLVKRVARSFANVGAAGIIAAEFGIIPNDPEDLTDGIVKCFQDWLAVRGSQHFTQADIKPVVALRNFIQSKKHLFLNPDHFGDFKGQEIVGYVKTINGRACFLLTNNSWELAQKLGKASDLAKSLDERGLLVTHSDGKRKVQTRVKNLDGSTTKERLYAVSANILSVDDFGELLPDDASDNDPDNSFGHDRGTGPLEITIKRANRISAGVH